MNIWDVPRSGPAMFLKSKKSLVYRIPYWLHQLGGRHKINPRGLQCSCGYILQPTDSLIHGRIIRTTRRGTGKRSRT